MRNGTTHFELPYLTPNLDHRYPTQPKKPLAETASKLHRNFEVARSKTAVAKEFRAARKETQREEIEESRRRREEKGEGRPET